MGLASVDLATRVAAATTVSSYVCGLCSPVPTLERKFSCSKFIAEFAELLHDGNVWPTFWN
jgi:hypothetical protein